MTTKEINSNIVSFPLFLVLPLYFFYFTTRWYILTIVKGQFRRWPMKIKLAPVLTSNLTSKDCENTEGGGM
jgi:hypothetical protein